MPSLNIRALWGTDNCSWVTVHVLTNEQLGHHVTCWPVLDTIVKGAFVD